MLDPSWIVVHCSDAPWGHALAIDGWHRDPPREWRMIGYHYVIGNGRPWGDLGEDPLTNGNLEAGRPLTEEGAHISWSDRRQGAEASNRNAIGICLVGKTRFTAAQIGRLCSTVLALMERHGIALDHVVGHCEIQVNKTCPNLPMDRVRAMLAGTITVDEFCTEVL